MQTVSAKIQAALLVATASWRKQTGSAGTCMTLTKVICDCQPVEQYRYILIGRQWSLFPKLIQSRAMATRTVIDRSFLCQWPAARAVTVASWDPSPSPARLERRQHRITSPFRVSGRRQLRSVATRQACRLAPVVFPLVAAVHRHLWLWS